MESTRLAHSAFIRNMAKTARLRNGLKKNRRFFDRAERIRKTADVHRTVVDTRKTSGLV